MMHFISVHEPAHDASRRFHPHLRQLLFKTLTYASLIISMPTDYYSHGILAPDLLDSFRRLFYISRHLRYYRH